MTMIHGLRLRIKALSREGREKLFYAALITLTASLAFCLGRLSAFYGQESGFAVTYQGAEATGTLQ